MAWTKAGPNDMPDVVWAQVSFIFSSFVLLETNDCKYRFYLQYRWKGEGWKTGNDENRPNNMRRVVWALGKSFLLFPSYYLILINILLHIQVVIYKIHKTERDWKLETRRVLSFRSTATTSDQNNQQEKLGLETQFISSIGKSFYFLLYYFTNKF